MYLRNQVRAELENRLAAHLPDALRTVWDVSAVLVMVENLNFTPANGFNGDWERKASFEGVVRAEIKNDNGKNSLPEMLVVSLVSAPIFIGLPDRDQVTLELGEPRPKARLTLRDARDALRENQVVAGLRFDVHGEICTYSPDPGRGIARLPNGTIPHLKEGNGS